MFADQVRIIIRSGKGGDGHVSFRREKYVPNGGPDGGDGGDGGSVILEVDKGINSLSDYRHRRKFSAENGEEGKKKRCHGKNGKDLILKVPEGTVVREAESGRIIVDMSGDHDRYVILPGGRGGLGNQHFATSRMQAPKYAKPGKEGLELEVIFELKLIADVGLVGFPNVGKSTLLSRLSNATPEIANYHFTTLNPILGVVDLGDGDSFVMADIPGLIEGASEGVGLGHEFLRHIERTKLLVHIVDGASVEGRDPVADIKAINHELASFSDELMKKPKIIAANKLDAIGDGAEEVLASLQAAYPESTVLGISAVSGLGIDSLLNEIRSQLSQLETEPQTYEQQYDPVFELTSIDNEGGYTVEVNEEGEYVVEGPAIEKMLGYTNLESEKGFLFFQRFIKERGITEDLQNAGISEGDTVRMYGLTFDYYR